MFYVCLNQFAYCLSLRTKKTKKDQGLEVYSGTNPKPSNHSPLTLPTFTLRNNRWLALAVSATSFVPGQKAREPNIGINFLQHLLRPRPHLQENHWLLFTKLQCLHCDVLQHNCPTMFAKTCQTLPNTPYHLQNTSSTTVETHHVLMYDTNIECIYIYIHILYLSHTHKHQP